ncbi:MAG TPA: MBL fold metallo-hydrolase [Polyangiaceae bacterium]|jgi:glyoxylase-like metal-dependent hydrolase (beta-lactamase superfamily II)|nr:MBL fold metallo-hydrolase [Polyangiaceae bacterium]
MIGRSKPEAALREVADGVFAYLQGDGSWGWSNAGLVTSRGEAMLVDTLYDLDLTRRMLDAMRRRTADAANIETVVNTHANGDHCWGNQLVAGADIVASRRAAEEMRELPPSLMKTLVRASRLATAAGGMRWATGLLARIGLTRATSFADAAAFVADKFGKFDFEGIELTPPTTTFEGALTLQVGDKQVHVVEVGPAHTRGDAIVHVPADGVVFTGDILFIGSHPILWEGPVENWIAACDLILALDVQTIVPGHGPVTDKAGVQRVKEYWQWLLGETRERFEAGMSSEDAARDIAAGSLGPSAGWIDAERIAVNVDTIHRQLSGVKRPADPLDGLARMARLGAARARAR